MTALAASNSLQRWSPFSAAFTLYPPEVRRYLTQKNSSNLFENDPVALPDGSAVSGSGETYSLRGSKAFETALKGSGAVSDSESIVSGDRGIPSVFQFCAAAGDRGDPVRLPTVNCSNSCSTARFTAARAGRTLSPPTASC